MISLDPIIPRPIAGDLPDPKVEGGEAEEESDGEGSRVILPDLLVQKGASRSQVGAQANQI